MIQSKCCKSYNYTVTHIGCTGSVERTRTKLLRAVAVIPVIMSVRGGGRKSLLHCHNNAPINVSQIKKNVSTAYVQGYN